MDLSNSTNRSDRHTGGSLTPKTAAVIAIGIVLIIYAISNFASASSFKRLKKACSETANGSVSRVERATDKANVRYYYDYSFTAGDKEVNIQGEIKKKAKPSVGDKLTVHYDSKNPNRCYTFYDDRSSSSTVRGILFLALGLSYIYTGGKSLMTLKMSGGQGIGGVMNGGQSMDNRNNNTNNRNNNDFNQLN